MRRTESTTGSTRIGPAVSAVRQQVRRLPMIAPGSPSEFGNLLPTVIEIVIAEGERVQPDAVRNLEYRDAPEHCRDGCARDQIATIEIHALALSSCRGKGLSNRGSGPMDA